jgi:SPP1 gp7 family putative phage head morphogenesis protein
MSLSLFSDDSEWIGSVASTGGWHDLCGAVGEDDSEFAAFCKQGYSDDAQKLRWAIGQFLLTKSYADGAHLPPGVHDTAAKLMKLVTDREGLVILSDSVIVEEDPEPETEKVSIETELVKALSELLHKPTLAIDFDATLQVQHPDDPTALTEPVDGAIEALRQLAEDFDLIIFSARDDFEPIWKWLQDHQATAYITDVTNIKPQQAHEFIDDRNVTFTGKWTPEFIAAVRAFQPYWKATRGARVLLIKYSYDLVQYNLAPEDAKKVLAIPVDEADWAEKGREQEPHITVLFGLLGVTAEQIQTAIEDIPTKITVDIIGLHSFPAGEDGEPLVLLVKSDELVRLRNALAYTFEHFDSHGGGYVPHITIGYLKPGTAAKYVCPIPDWEQINLSELILSRKDNTTAPLVKARTLKIDSAYAPAEVVKARHDLADVFKKVFRRQRDKAKDKAGRLLKTRLDVHKAWMEAGLIKVYHSVDELPEYMHDLPKRQQRQWMAVWNSAYARAKKPKDDGGLGMDTAEAEAFAFRNANGVAGPNASKVLFPELLKQEEDPEAVNIADAIYDALRELFDEIPAAAAKPLERAALAGVEKGIAEVEVADSGMISGLNAGAHTWADGRAAELVGKRVTPTGELIQNPDAKWVVSDTTRDELRRIVTSGFAKETPMEEMVKQIQEAGAFSDARAEMIARTEIAFAQVQSNYKVWKETGVVKTITWHVSVDHPELDECDDNQGVVVPLGTEFPSGDLFPPAHPNCWCAIIAVGFA